jgi:hypothetical protein
VSKSETSPPQLPDNLLPVQLSINVGGHFGPSYSVELEESVLTYRYSKRVTNFPPEWASRSEKIRPSQKRWQTFRAALDQLQVWSWRTDYRDPSVCDGTSWSAEIVYWDRAIRSPGQQLLSRQEWRSYFDCRSHPGRHFRAVLQTGVGACWPPLSVAAKRH